MSKVFFLSLISLPLFSSPLNISGQWNATLADDNTQKACNATFTVTQTDKHFTMTERKYDCSGYTLTGTAIDADIQSVNADTVKLVSNGKVLGIMQASLIQITLDEATSQAMRIEFGGKPGLLNQREMLYDGSQTHNLAGIAKLATDEE